MPAPTSTIRVPARTYDRLKGLARAAGKPMSVVLEEAVERYEADRFFRDADAAYQRLRTDSEASKQELVERSLLEQTLQDGLEEE